MPNEHKGLEYWAYWGTASLIAAFVGGVAFAWLSKHDPFQIQKIKQVTQ